MNLLQASYRDKLGGEVSWSKFCSSWALFAIANTPIVLAMNGVVDSYVLPLTILAVGAVVCGNRLSQQLVSVAIGKKDFDASPS